MKPTHKENVNWSRQHFDRMAIGCVWGVPRSGLAFVKTDDKTLSLNDRMPFIQGMPGTQAEWEKWQQTDFHCIERHFVAAGVVVKDNTKKETK